MDTITTLDEIVDNLHTLDRDVRSTVAADRDAAVDLVRRGHNLVAGRCCGRWLLGPSRFVGYRGNTLDRHREFAERDGKETDPAIRAQLGDHQPNEELEREYQDFCRRHGVRPTEHARSFWVVR